MALVGQWWCGLVRTKSLLNESHFRCNRARVSSVCSQFSSSCCWDFLVLTGLNSAGDRNRSRLWTASFVSKYEDVAPQHQPAICVQLSLYYDLCNTGVVIQVMKTTVSQWKINPATAAAAGTARCVARGNGFSHRPHIHTHTRYCWGSRSPHLSSLPTKNLYINVTRSNSRS